MRTLAEMWSNLAFESFPALFVVLLRSFGGIGDDGLRGFELKDADGYVLFFGRPETRDDAI